MPADPKKSRAAMLRQLRRWSACEGGMAWVKSTDAASFAELWPLFERADWMLWLLVRVRPGDKVLRVACALDCAETALPVYERRYQNDTRVRDCIAIGRKWCDGKATDEDLRKSAADAADAADAAYDAYDAADDAYDAADAARAAAYAAYVADAAERAAAAYVADAAERSSAHLAMCALIRKRVPTLEVADARRILEDR